MYDLILATHMIKAKSQTVYNGIQLVKNNQDIIVVSFK